jgi:RNA polymerase sporulation-specific sigma factor
MQLSLRVFGFRTWLASRLGRGGLYYIHGPEALPQPLSREEENEIIAVLESGGDGAEEARQILIERNLRLVAFIARRYENPPTA